MLIAKSSITNNNNSVALICEPTILTERSLLVGKVGAYV
jgi:hypothetical protein